MKDFKKAAQAATSGSFIMEGREKMEMTLLIATYPEGVTVNGADLINGDSGLYAAVTFVEDPKKYINGGKMLTDIVKEWAADYQDNETMSKDLAAAGGVKMKFEKSRTKSGRDFTVVTVL